MDLDVPLTPPLRIHTIRVQQISSEVAQKRLDSFLHRFRTRSLAKNSGETTTSVQLQKLADALNEEHTHIREVTDSRLARAECSHTWGTL
ncbi:hypothetical protein BD309DRAFT_1016333 [Dichomitus squalens]|uniref:Uncharacterized protein n=1 Tax=Dichomitus squalens TaxID=114155 RepID=A0A4Q9P1U2_9APHY|nr:hypothetical protein BD309DRAFT_1016333 [Dichomitus squalens]TBU57672.1 hypothetical protein BD310DRAFT_977971 [Dichomitus squalens]